MGVGLGSHEGFGGGVGRSGGDLGQMLAPAGGRVGKLAEEFHALGGRMARWRELAAEHGPVSRFLQPYRLAARPLKEKIRSKQVAEEAFVAGRHMTQRRGEDDGILLRRGLDLDFEPLRRGEAAGQILAESERDSEGLGEGVEEVLGGGFHGSFKF